jgi:hypothetical protein
MNVRKGDNRKGAKTQRVRKEKIRKEVLCGFSLRFCAFAVQDFMRFFSAPLCLCG